ncbi:hypothetical protein MHUMG1_00298 [Metarhizium humberi]|uniref:Uncharacterized protein n=1 Tax=Metarhizium humberi TaxID=2596975 RepID=A0A9P8SB38_9HYPO|nr:hypothetical protein MHUMG1_00298 [Metarhizium humberi]
MHLGRDDMQLKASRPPDDSPILSRDTRDGKTRDDAKAPRLAIYAGKHGRQTEWVGWGIVGRCLGRKSAQTRPACFSLPDPDLRDRRRVYAACMADVPFYANTAHESRTEGLTRDDVMQAAQMVRCKIVMLR